MPIENKNKRKMLESHLPFLFLVRQDNKQKNEQGLLENPFYNYLFASIYIWSRNCNRQ
jgi:hypothetical protein